MVGVNILVKFITDVRFKLTHNYWVYKIVLMFYIPCYIQLFELFINKIKIWKRKK